MQEIGGNKIIAAGSILVKENARGRSFVTAAAVAFLTTVICRLW